MIRPKLLDNFTDWDLECAEQGYAFVHFDEDIRELFLVPWVLRDSAIFVCKVYVQDFGDLTLTSLAQKTHEMLTNFSHTLELSKVHEQLILRYIHKEHPEVFL